MQQENSCINQPLNEQLPKSAVDLSEVTNQFRSGLSLQVNGLKVEHTLTPPSEIETFPTTYHFLCLNLRYGSRQVNRFDASKYEGAINIGDFFLLPAGIAGAWAWETAGEGLVFMINSNFLSRIAVTTECINLDKLEVRSILLNHDHQLEAIARLFLREMNNNKLGGKLYAESLANLFAIHLLRHYCVFQPTLQEYQGGLSAPKLQRALDFIHAHLDTQLSLDAIATEVNMSSYYFCKLFKQSMGVSPWKYVIEQRVERAKELLRREIAIADIALLCGFSNQTHLNKHFKKCVGVTPNTYRHQ